MVFFPYLTLKKKEGKGKQTNNPFLHLLSIFSLAIITHNCLKSWSCSQPASQVFPIQLPLDVFHPANFNFLSKEWLKVLNLNFDVWLH